MWKVPVGIYTCGMPSTEEKCMFITSSVETVVAMEVDEGNTIACSVCVGMTGTSVAIRTTLDVEVGSIVGASVRVPPHAARRRMDNNAGLTLFMDNS